MIPFGRKYRLSKEIQNFLNELELGGMSKEDPDWELYLETREFLYAVLKGKGEDDIRAGIKVYSDFLIDIMDWEGVLMERMIALRECIETYRSY
jgi:hypothetical protein